MILAIGYLCVCFVMLKIPSLPTLELQGGNVLLRIYAAYYICCIYFKLQILFLCGWTWCFNLCVCERERDMAFYHLIYVMWSL